MTQMASMLRLILTVYTHLIKIFFLNIFCVGLIQDYIIICLNVFLMV